MEDYLKKNKIADEYLKASGWLYYVKTWLPNGEEGTAKFQLIEKIENHGKLITKKAMLPKTLIGILKGIDIMGQKSGFPRY